MGVSVRNTGVEKREANRGVFVIAQVVVQAEALQVGVVQFIKNGVNDRPSNSPRKGSLKRMWLPSRLYI